MGLIGLNFCFGQFLGATSSFNWTKNRRNSLCPNLFDKMLNWEYNFKRQIDFRFCITFGQSTFVKVVHFHERDESSCWKIRMVLFGIRVFSIRFVSLFAWCAFGMKASQQYEIDWEGTRMRVNFDWNLEVNFLMCYGSKHLDHLEKVIICPNCQNFGCFCSCFCILKMGLPWFYLLQLSYWLLVTCWTYVFLWFDWIEIFIFLNNFWVLIYIKLSEKLLNSDAQPMFDEMPNWGLGRSWCFQVMHVAHKPGLHGCFSFRLGSFVS